MEDDQLHRRKFRSMSNYVKTHCETCAAGWVRTGEKPEEKIYFCLLDREAVWPQMSHCNRFEPLEAEDGTPRH